MQPVEGRGPYFARAMHPIRQRRGFPLAMRFGPCSAGPAAVAPAVGRCVLGWRADGDPAAPGVELGHHARRLGLARPAARGQGRALLRGDVERARATSARFAAGWPVASIMVVCPLLSLCMASRLPLPRAAARPRLHHLTVSVDA